MPDWNTEENVWTANGEITVKVGDETITLSKEEATVDKIKEIAREHGIRRFKVYVDGTDVSPDEFAEKVADASEIEIVPKDKAG